MSDAEGVAIGPGARMAAARRARDLHIASLAAQLKVSPSRLEALEAERWDALPGATHARALATSVCHALGIDPAPVLADMPPGGGPALERVGVGLNEPVRDGDPSPVGRRAWWALAAVLVVAAAVVLWSRWGGGGASSSDPLWSGWFPVGGEASVEALPVASAPLNTLSARVASGASPSAESSTPTPAPASKPADQGAEPVLELRAERAASWVGVLDAQGVSVASRLLAKGDVLRVQATPPLRVTVGNAPGLSVIWRGQAQALSSSGATPVLRLELK